MRSALCHPTQAPILFILGPSGVGKSTLAQFLAQEAGFFHLELDLPTCDGIDPAGIRREWDYFFEAIDAAPLCEALHAMLQSSKRSALVASFSSDVCFNSDHLGALSRQGVTVIVLFAAPDECLGAFLDREQQSGRRLGADHWHRCNANFERFQSSEFDPYRLHTFQNSNRVERMALLQEVKRRLRLSPTSAGGAFVHPRDSIRERH